VLFLSAIYVLLLSSLWIKLSDLLLAYGPSRADIPDPAGTYRQSGMIFVTLNSSGFALTLLSFSRTRSFSPVSRYLVPVFFGVLLSAIVTVLLLFFYDFVPYFGPLAVTTMGSFVFIAHLIVPGLLAGQLFRFPRPRLT
jgi:hypothetical protein